MKKQQDRINYARWIPGSLVGTEPGFAYIERIVSWQPAEEGQQRLPETILVRMTSKPYELREVPYDRIRLYPLYLLTRKEITKIDKHGHFSDDQKEVIERYRKTLPPGVSFLVAYERMKERVLTERSEFERLAKTEKEPLPGFLQRAG